MQIILTHEQADFDALASLLAAHLLNERALPVLPRRLNRNVRAFLALYGMELPFVDPRDLPGEPVEMVILVDSQSMVSVKGMGPDTRVQVIDHHPRREGLPEDWQLGFYGNEFRVVLIPAEYWQRPDIDVRQWLEETDASPRFLSEWPPDINAQQRARSGMAQLGTRAIGFIIRLAQRPDDVELSIYKELQTDHNIVFDLQPLSPAERSEVEQLLNKTLGQATFGLCWHGATSSL